MATAPVKSQPLHNFYLPFLKWGNKNQTNANHRYREHRSSSSTEQELDRGDCSKSDSESWRRKHATGSSNEQRNRSCSSQREVDEALEGECDGKADESVAKTRKLRPRKGAAKASIDEIGGGSKIRDSRCEIAAAAEQNENLPKSSRLRGVGDSHGNGKSKLWVSLSREEIEEDVYSITGSRASRRPKKRTKTLQKLIDNISPGFYLIGASADSYRAFDNL